MRIFRDVLRWLFTDVDLAKKETHTSSHIRRGQSSTGRVSGVGRSKTSKVEVLQRKFSRPPVPYWQLRGWRRVSDCLYLGYFKTPLGKCHGVIKWRSQLSYGIYVHNVPAKILRGPHAACFTEVKSNKFRIHFAQQPKDLNSVIFYVETLLQKGFQK